MVVRVVIGVGACVLASVRWFVPSGRGRSQFAIAINWSSRPHRIARRDARHTASAGRKKRKRKWNRTRRRVAREESARRKGATCDGGGDKSYDQLHHPWAVFCE